FKSLEQNRGRRSARGRMHQLSAIGDDDRKSGATPLTLSSANVVSDLKLTCARALSLRFCPLEAGITIVHISTELRLGWRRGLEAAFTVEPDNLVPYQLYRKASEAMEEVVSARLNLFRGV